MTELDQRIAIVTGAASGIGAASADALARLGATVIGFDRVPGGAQVAIDISDAAAVTDAVAKVEAQHGRIDILVNCAGIGTPGTITEIGLADWDRTMSVNLRGTFVMCRAVIPGMLERRHGSIINIGSTFGLAARDRTIAYSVSKAAVIHLTRCIAIDLADSGVRANCICPGIIETGMTAPIFAPEMAEVQQRNLAIHAMRRHGHAEEVAEAVAFLASDRASYITGTALPVDGGYTAGKWPAQG